jgi:predicted porin
MNKKLVAVAVAGLLAAPLAQAQTANVTLYGRINIDMEFVSGRLANNTDPTVYRVTSNSTRFGLRGTESLGGGLNAIFQIENGSIQATTTGGNLAGRDTFVGLSGNWGRFYMGRFQAPYDDIHGIFGNDNTASTSILSTASVWAQGFAGQPVNGGFDDRLQQSIRYDMPSMAGFSGAAQFSTYGGNVGPSGQVNPSSNTNAQSYGLFYRNGPAIIGTAYEYHHNTRGTSQLPLSDWAWSVAAKWQFSGFNIAGVYEKMEYEVNNGANPLMQVRNKLKRNFWAVDTTINIGANGQLFIYYGQAGDGKGSAENTPAPVITNTTCNAAGVCVAGAVTGSNISRVAGLAKGPDTGAKHWEISYSYDLSRRTRIYTGYVKLDNDSNASYNFNINAYPGNAGGATGGPVGMNLSGFVMGMYHNF